MTRKQLATVLFELAVGLRNRQEDAIKAIVKELKKGKE
jgi:hypothetical protein